MNDVMHELALADPLRHQPADTSPARLDRIHALLDVRIADSVGVESGSRSVAALGEASGVEQFSGPRRRWLALGAAAAGLAIAGTAALSLVEPGEGPSLAVTSVALTEDGRLACTPPVGYSEPIDPADAAAIMLPTWLPEGWQVGHVWAVRETSPVCFFNPSLVLAETDADGNVTRSAMVYGPIDQPIDGVGMDAVEVPVAGTTGQLFRVSSNDKYDLQWLWTDAAGGHWLMRTYGYSEKSGGRVAEALEVVGERIGVAVEATPKGTTVVFQRTGDPYPAWTQLTRVYVSLGRKPLAGQEAEALIDVLGSETPDTFGLDVVVPGETRIAWQDERPSIEMVREGVLARGAIVAPGTTAHLSFEHDFDPTPGTIAPDQWSRVISSLESVAPDDPRLESLALK